MVDGNKWHGLSIVERQMSGLSIPVWRLTAHHDHPAEALRWAKEKNILAIGWGNIGDLQKLKPASKKTISDAIGKTYPALGNRGSGGVCLEDFLFRMKIGDLVIVNANGKRRFVMEVAGKYGFEIESPREPIGDYRHQRRGEFLSIDPERLWRAVGREVKAGHNIRWPLIECARPISQATRDGLIS
jgi:hypothetical protein